MPEADAANRIDIRLRMDLELHNLIAEAAKKLRVPVAAFIRTAAMEKLDRMEKKEGEA